jgi:DNA-binding FadR family transcriptional regulator
MKRKSNSFPLSPFLEYLAQFERQKSDRLPPLNEISRELGISIASLREQLEVARMMGLVEVKPKIGLRKLPFTFTPGVYINLAYALTLEHQNYDRFSELRNHIETAYWFQAVALLTDEDHDRLRKLVTSAVEKLKGHPIQIPHPEHRELHLSIFRRLENLFVTGILEAYWDMYEAEGMSLYADIEYLNKVWDYHNRMVESICSGDFQKGHQAMIDHMDLISHRPLPARADKFE